MKSTNRPATSPAISSVLASTMTRISASVPEARTSTRPAPARASYSRFTAAASSSEAMTRSFTPPLWGTSTLMRTWG